MRLLRDLFVRLQQIFVRRQYRKVVVGGATGLDPIIGADEDDHALLRGFNHFAKGVLQHRITLFNRQQRKDIAVGREPLADPQINVVRQQQADDRCPEPCRQSALVQNNAASSALMAPSPVWIAENTISVRSPLASLMTMFLT